MQTINTNVFDTLKALMGDMTGELVAIFIEDSYKLLDEIKLGVENKNIDQLGKAAHTLKSSAKNMGADRLADYCLLIEKKIERREVDSDLSQVYSSACTEMSEVKNILNKLV